MQKYFQMGETRDKDDLLLLLLLCNYWSADMNNIRQNMFYSKVITLEEFSDIYGKLLNISRI